MANWKLVSIAVLLSLNLSGMMLFLVASKSSTIAVERRWHLWIVGLLLMAPSIIHMFLTVPRREDVSQDDEEGELEGPNHLHCAPDADPPA